MTISNRPAALKALADAVSSIDLARPLRVAIDGRTASGKTTLADELAKELRSSGREVIRTSIDGFHRPKAERYARGRYSHEGYYYDGRDLIAINSLLLLPLGPEGNREYRTASFDLLKDEPIEQFAKIALADAILIVDGTFLQRPELAPNWDLAIFIDTNKATSEKRGVGRDTELLGGIDAARQLYASRYQPAYDLYESICAPSTNADALFNNEDIENPVLKINASGRLQRGYERSGPKAVMA
ncbi:uridylate kinase [Neorhizobium sp. JUb45]|uniref:uridylate kinase n=1 Tax=unclassified Neorhizobium TaxID=2629175 RepID=UPI0010F04DD2|nr:uridylate kinase [Neorhizobium sp. JUb45]TCR01002.1 uridine kinase [Neorhizobium sp. JUb45]